MAKRRTTLKVRLPSYAYPRNLWRKNIHAAILEELTSEKVKYNSKDRIELKVILYLDDRAILRHDVDNRLKDIMDAIQGRAGGTKKEHSLVRIIPNDNQIYKVTVEKRTPPKQSLGMGHLTIRTYKLS